MRWWGKLLLKTLDNLNRKIAKSLTLSDRTRCRCRKQPVVTAIQLLAMDIKQLLLVLDTKHPVLLLAIKHLLMDMHPLLSMKTNLL